jgi:hypothetical protein
MLQGKCRRNNIGDINLIETAYLPDYTTFVIHNKYGMTRDLFFLALRGSNCVACMLI